jgi:hypothetical protein
MHAFECENRSLFLCGVFFLRGCDVGGISSWMLESNHLCGWRHGVVAFLSHLLGGSVIVFEHNAHG